MSGNESNNLVKGALILTLAGLVSKVLSAGYRIPIQNLTGDLGFYIYQQIYPLLGIALVLALYGFPSAVSKVTNDHLAKGRNLTFKGFYIPLFIILLLINGTIFGFIYLNASTIADLMGDQNLSSSVKTTSFVFLMIPFTSLLRGVFQGNYQMKPTAVSQIGEQLARVIIIIMSAVFLANNKGSIYEIGQAGAIAAISGAIVAIVILMIYFIKKAPWQAGDYPIQWGYYWRMLVFFGMIAALNHMILLVIQLADAFTLVPNLLEYGLPQEAAMKAKGVFDRGQPLIQLGTVLGSSFALALIPSLSREKLKRNPLEIHHFARSALLFSFCLTIGAAIGLILIFPEANLLLFQDKSGTESLRILMLAVIFCPLAVTATSILQSLYYIKRTALFILAALMVKGFGNQLLVPLMGITGSAIATVISLVFLCYLVFRTLKQVLPELRFFKELRWQALGLASSSMVIYVQGIDLLVPNGFYSARFLLFIYVIFVALTGAICYLFLLVKFSAFTEKQLKMLPYASILIRIHRGKN